MSRHSVASCARAAGACIFVLFCLTLAGCSSRLSASHLQKKPWADSARQELTAKFMAFSFETLAQDGAMRVRGTARVLRENLPAWADTVSELTVHAYLCDEDGEVLANARRPYPQQRIPDSGFLFDFTLAPTQRQAKGYFVSFGYSAMFTQGSTPRQQGQTPAANVFFANEQAAVTR